jgi:hypothetical protein
MAKGAAAASSPRRITAAQRQVRAVELRVRGFTLDQIAKELGYRTRQGALVAIEAQLAKRERPAAEALAKVHLERLELMVKPVMDKVAAHLDGRTTLSVKQVNALTLALTRNLAAQAKYVDVYAEGQGLGPIASLLDRLLSSAPDGVDPDDPMTIPVDLPDDL